MDDWGRGVGGWGWRAECQIRSLYFSFLSSPFRSPFLLWSCMTRGVHGDAVADSPQRQAPEATASACVLCLEKYMNLFICIYISSSCCSQHLLPCRSPSIFVFEKFNKRGQREEREESDWMCCRPLNFTSVTSINLRLTTVHFWNIVLNFKIMCMLVDV